MRTTAIIYCFAFLGTRSSSRFGYASTSRATFSLFCSAAPKSTCLRIQASLNTMPKTGKRRSPRIFHSSSNRSENTNIPAAKDDRPLLDLENLVEGTVVKRPSSTIKSPYVADVRLAGADTDAPFALAHAPALDVGGLCSPGSTVLMKARPPGGKTSHSIELVIAADRNGKEGAVLVGAHPRLGEELAEEVLRRGLLEDCIGFAGADSSPESPRKKSPKKAKKKKETDEVEEQIEVKPGVYLKKQVTYGDSRVDFELVRVGKEPQKESPDAKALIEVKNIVCADYFFAHAPEKKGKNHCVVISPEEDESQYKRTAIFPWGRIGQEFEGKKVVSARAIKHIRNLVDIAKHPAVQPIVMFVVNRSDCDTVRACIEACPMFAEELANASKNGVLVVAFRVRWSRDGKCYFDGIVPVNL